MKATKVLAIILLSALCVPAQVLVERGALTTSGSTGAAAVGKGVAAALSKVGQAVDQAGKQPAGGAKVKTAEAPVVRLKVTADTAAKDRPGPQPAPEPAVTAEQLAGIQVGITRHELLARAGNPSMRLTIPDGAQSLEIYRYRIEGKDAAVVQLKDGVVTSIER
ncbi:MAG: hypothetical protein HYR60_08180 [Acidobacteria bacterium]|nr:hypothetical protein [Acidobacteriota bacterium]